MSDVRLQAGDKHGGGLEWQKQSTESGGVWMHLKNNAVGLSQPFSHYHVK